MPDMPTSQHGSRPRDVYHKEKKAKRHRDQLDSGIPVARPNRTRDDNPARVTFLQSVRRFAGVTALMAVVLFIAIKGLTYMDLLYSQNLPQPPDVNRDFAREVMPAEAPSAPDVAPPVSPAVLGDDQRPTGDEAMRQAAFLSARARQLEQEGQYGEAIERYRKALDLWPYQPHIWAVMGRLHLRLGELPRAQTALERAVSDAPEDKQLLNDLGVVYYQQGNMASAIKSFSAYVEAEPTAAPAYFNLALCYLSRNDVPRARTYIDRYLALEPDDPRALRQAAYIDAATNNLSSAIAALEKAIAKDPTWPVLYLDAATVESRNTNTEKCIAYLEKATELTSPLLVQRIYANAAFNVIRSTDEARVFERNLAAKAAKTEVPMTGTLIEAESPGPILSVEK
jgi:tetratricopeptide (TPR) repeat protein